MLTKFAALLLVVTIGQLHAGSHAYDGRHVDVTGRASRPHAGVLTDGTRYERFAVCAGWCMQVVAIGTPAIPAGQTITVHGTYYVHKNLGGFVLHGIEADPGSL